MICPTELDWAARRLAQMEEAKARDTTHISPVQGEPMRIRTRHTTDIDTANATADQRLDTKPSLEVALPRAKRVA